MHRTGRLVGGHDTLAKIEKVPTDADDRPKEEVRIIDAVVFVNPYENVDAEMEAAHAKASDPEGAKAAEAARIAAEDAQAWYNMEPAKPTAHRAGIGKYIANRHVEPPRADEPPPPKRPKAAGPGAFGDFSKW